MKKKQQFESSSLSAPIIISAQIEKDLVSRVIDEVLDKKPKKV